MIADLSGTVWASITIIAILLVAIVFLIKVLMLIKGEKNEKITNMDRGNLNLDWRDTDPNLERVEEDERDK